MELVGAGQNRTDVLISCFTRRSYSLVCVGYSHRQVNSLITAQRARQVLGLNDVHSSSSMLEELRLRYLSESRRSLSRTRKLNDLIVASYVCVSHLRRAHDG